MGNKMIDWKRDLDYVEETVKYGAVSVIYFILIIIGFAYRKIEFKTEIETKYAGYNVFVLFMVLQCVCKFYGGNAGFFIFLISSIMSYILLPGVLEAIGLKKSKRRKEKSS